MGATVNEKDRQMLMALQEDTRMDIVEIDDLIERYTAGTASEEERQATIDGIMARIEERATIMAGIRARNGR